MSTSRELLSNSKPEPVDLSEAETKDLIIELESRGHEVDIDPVLDEFSDSAIEIEFRARGLYAADDGDLRELWEAFYTGRTDRAIELAKKIAQDSTGRFL